MTEASPTKGPSRTLRLRSALLGALLALLASLAATGQETQERWAESRYWLRLRHIVIAHSAGPRLRSSRSYEAARRFALSLGERLNPKNFAILARISNDSPLRKDAGLLAPALRIEDLPGEFSKALSTLEIGELTGPLEDADGFHYFYREPCPQLAASQILIGYKGAARAPASIQRSRQEALEKAQKLLDELRAGASFEELARREGDGVEAAEGGALGLLPRELIDPTVGAALAALRPGELGAKLCESPFGFHILRREPIVLWRCEQAVFGFDRFWAWSEGQAHEALVYARDAIERGRAGHADWTYFSQSIPIVRLIPASGPQATPALREALRELSPGDFVRLPVEGPFGYYVLRRLAD
jgi:hypothetical protein